MDHELREFPIGQGEILREGADGFILAIGATVQPALEAAKRLEKDNLFIGVANMRFVKPVDVDLVRGLIAKGVRNFITVEDNVLAGGFGSAVREDLALEECKILSLGIRDRYIPHGAQSILRDLAGISAEKITARAAEFFKSQPAARSAEMV
jgi:1-deoxy-D-xylulose-5-phosphate synthase